jgi:hypothetical protein
MNSNEMFGQPWIVGRVCTIDVEAS